MQHRSDGGQIGRRTFLAAGLSTGAAAAIAPAVASSPATAASVPAMPRIIDVHAHAILRSWYDWIVRKNAPNPPRMEGGVAVPEWSPRMAIDLMDANGIEAMILSNAIGTKDMTKQEAVPLARTMNEELAELIRTHPKRFGAFAVLPLQDPDASVRELVYALDTLGFDGVCIPTSVDGAYPGDPRFEPIFAELDRRRATAFVHPHAPAYTSQIDIPVIPGMIEFVFDSTRALTSLVCSGIRRRYRNFNYIATHGGGTLPFVADRIAYVAGLGTGYRVPLTYDEVMEDLKSIHYDLAITTSRPALVSLREFVPVSQILFGFDFPFVSGRTVAPAIKHIATSGVFSEAELATIATDNALRLLPGYAARRAKPA